MVVACAGDFDWDRIRSIVADACGQWQKQPTERELKHYTGSKKQKRIEKANLVREHICLMSPAVSAQDNRRFAASLLGAIIGDDVGSRFFWELVDKALAEIAAMMFGAMDGTGLFCSYISCSSENVSKVLDIVRRIFQTLSENGVTEDELIKVKNKLLSALVIKNELPMGRLVEIGFNWQYLKQYRTIDEDVNAIKAVTIDDIHSLLKEFNPGDFTQLSMGPAR